MSMTAVRDESKWKFKEDKPTHTHTHTHMQDPENPAKTVAKLGEGEASKALLVS